MLDSYTGEHFRPPIIVSSGKSLLLQFRGNGVTGAGYKAEVTFVSSKQLKDNQSVPFTDCGGMVSGPGGAITMMNMIENTSDIKIYDCIWIIRPSNNYMMMKTHISLRIAEFYGMASRSNLVIRQGITSDASEIETILWPNNGLSKENHIVPILTGYYIRLQGVFGRSSKLAIAYSVFNYLSCYIGSEFLCNNNHCISVRLHCDGFDHCGDESDEPESCEEDWTHLQNDRRWYSHKPNYYFPKIDQYPDIKAATGIFIISTLGIFAVLSAWMVILYRMGVRARHQRELQNHLQTISELLDRQEELNTTDEPPDYEAPPDYEEVIKIGMDQEISECRQHQRRHCRHNHDRSRSRNTADNQCNRSIQTPLYNSEPSTSSSSNPFQKNANFRELAQRNPAATSVCDIVESCRTPFVRNYHSAASISSGSEQPSDIVEQQQHQQRNIKSPSDTRSQFEENSNEFRDESLNISFTLAIPHNTTDSDLKPGNSTKNLCNESTYLKRSFKVPRLRHTFSSPETFSNDFFKAEPLSYGTYWPNKRNSSYSNASNFGSELPPDPSPTSVYSFKQVNPVQDSLQTIAGIPTDDSVEYAAIVRPDFDSVDANSGSTINIQNQLISYFGEHGNLSSCFGNVNNRSRLSSKIRSTHTRRHVRSKSFTNCGSRQKTTKMNRSSSADFLLRSKSQKREHPPYFRNNCHKNRLEILYLRQPFSLLK